MFTPALTARASALIARYASLGLKIATAESCTGGLVAGLLTEIPGSSAVLERGFVTYSNDAKRELLGVPAATVEAYGAVSKATARAMAQGAIAHSHAQVAVSVTGVAGPGRGSVGSRSAWSISHARGQARGSWRSSAGSAMSAGPGYAWRRSSRRWNCWSGLVARIIEGALPSPREEARGGDDGARLQRRAC